MLKNFTLKGLCLTPTGMTRDFFEVLYPELDIDNRQKFQISYAQHITEKFYCVLHRTVPYPVWHLDVLYDGGPVFLKYGTTFDNYRVAKMLMEYLISDVKIHSWRDVQIVFDFLEEIRIP